MGRGEKGGGKRESLYLRNCTMENNNGKRNTKESDLVRLKYYHVETKTSFFHNKYVIFQYQAGELL